VIERADTLPKRLIIEYFIVFVQEDTLHASKKNLVLSPLMYR